MGIYSSMYKLLDMAYTTLNVTGDVYKVFDVIKHKKLIL